MKLLHIDSSVLGEASVSRRLTAEIVARFRAAHPDLEIVHRDLAAAPLSHISDAFVAATRPGAPGGGTAPPAASAEDAAALAEFFDADVVVIGAPMYNFAVSSHLKAWIDRLLIAGKTFAYTETGPKGLCGGKRMIIASSRGGIYTAGPFAQADHQETYLRAIFGFIGITDLSFVRAEGLAMGPEKRQAAIAAAESEIANLAA